MSDIKSQIAEAREALAPFLDKQLVVFMQNYKDTMLGGLQLLGFKNVVAVDTGRAKIETIQKLAQIIVSRDCFALTNLRDTTGQNAIAAWHDYLLNLQVKINQSKQDVQRAQKYISKIIPVVVGPENYQIREKYLMVFAKFTIPGAFFFVQPSRTNPKDQIPEILPQLIEYAIEYFTGKDTALEKIKNKQKEEELSAQKAEADKLRAEGDKHKQNGNYEQAILFFEKAIKVYPADPQAYMESGQMCVRIKKYPRALERYRQAEEVAMDAPEPNKEIGHVRILQVKERIDRGESPDTPEIQALLKDAESNFKTAFSKAAEIKKLGADDEKKRNVEAVSKIAGEIFKLDLGAMLGARHPLARTMNDMALASLSDVTKGDVKELSGAQLICMALGASAREEFSEAEDMLFRAAGDNEVFEEACSEINYLGAAIRQKVGPAQAVNIYNRLLELSPPNRAPALYNLALAHILNNNATEAGGALVQSLYSDQNLPKKEEKFFYQSQRLMDLLVKMIKYFSYINMNGKRLMAIYMSARKTFPPQTKAQLDDYHKKFEGLLAAAPQKAMEAFGSIYAKLPHLFDRPEAYDSKPMMDVVKTVRQRLAGVNSEQAKAITRGLSLILDCQVDYKTRKSLQFLENLSKTNKTEALKLFERFAMSPSILDSPVVYHSGFIIDLTVKAIEAHESGWTEADKKITAAAQSVIEKKGRFLNALEFKSQSLAALENQNQSLAASLITKSVLTFPEALVRPYFYNNESILALCGEIVTHKFSAVDQGKMTGK